jgi:hypothetical protein
MNRIDLDKVEMLKAEVQELKQKLDESKMYPAISGKKTVIEHQEHVKMKQCKPLS